MQFRSEHTHELNEEFGGHRGRAGRTECSLCSAKCVSGSCIVGVSRLYRYIDMYSYCSYSAHCQITWKHAELIGMCGLLCSFHMCAVCEYIAEVKEHDTN